jgi:hypothetical protein
VLVFFFFFFLLAALVAGPTTWQRWCERQRIARWRVKMRAAQTEWIAQRACLVHSLCDRLIERGLLQRQVRETLHARASALSAAQRRVALRPEDPRAHASWLRADAAFERAIARTLDSVRPETLLEPRLQRLTQSLAALNERLQGGWSLLDQTMPSHHPTSSWWSFGQRHARPRPWHPDAGWA